MFGGAEIGWIPSSFLAFGKNKSVAIPTDNRHIHHAEDDSARAPFFRSSAHKKLSQLSRALLLFGLYASRNL